MDISRSLYVVSEKSAYQSCLTDRIGSSYILTHGPCIQPHRGLRSDHPFLGRYGLHAFLKEASCGSNKGGRQSLSLYANSKMSPYQCHLPGCFKIVAVVAAAAAAAPSHLRT